MINQISMVFSGATSSFTLASPWLPRSSGKGGESGGKISEENKKKAQHFHGPPPCRKSPAGRYLAA